MAVGTSLYPYPSSDRRTFVSVGAALVLYGSTTPDYLESQLQLMAAYLVELGYRPEGLAKFRQAVQARMRTFDAMPGGVAQRDLSRLLRLLRLSDPRYDIPAEDVLLARNYEDLKAAMRQAREAGPIEVGIVGNIDVDSATALVAKTFGALPAREAGLADLDEARVARFPVPTPMPLVLRHKGEPNQAMALVYWPGIDDSDAKKTRTLDLLKRVLQLKLIDRVRERDGTTYSPGTQAYFSNVSPGYGYLGVSLDLVPGDVDRFLGVVDEIAASMANGEISDDELVRARLPALEAFRNSLNQNGYWLGLVSTAQSNPRKIDRHRMITADYESDRSRRLEGGYCAVPACACCFSCRNLAVCVSRQKAVA